MGWTLSQTSRSPCCCTKARALPGLDSRCNTREACAYSTGSCATASNAGMRITLCKRISSRLAISSALRCSLLKNWMGCSAFDGSLTGCTSVFVLSKYGSTWVYCASLAFGASTVVESISCHCSVGFQPCGTINAVPRTSRISFNFSPRAAR